MSIAEEILQESQGNDKKSLRELERRIQELEKSEADLQQRIKRYQKPRIRINPGEPYKRSSTDFVRVIIPDTHGSIVQEDALAACLADVQHLQPSEVVLLGDHIDCSGFLAQHHTLGYVADTSYTYDDDIKAGNDFLDNLQRCAPGATIHYLYGNHEERPETWAVTAALRKGVDAEILRKAIAPEYVLGLEARGIHYYRSVPDQMYEGVKVPATIRLGHCYFTHGNSHGKHAAMNHLVQFASNVVFGHIHRIQQYASRTVHGGVASAWSVGCLSKLQPTWKRRDFTNWNHGYGVQFCKQDGRFLHITIHIINGESYLLPLVEMMGLAKAV